MTYDAMSLTVTIDSVDRTAYVVPGSIDIKSVLTRRLDTCHLILENAASIEPTEWDEIVITDGSEKVFGGYILHKSEIEGPNLGLNFALRCVDYAALLDTVIVKEEYEDETDGYILNDLFTDYLSEINASTYVTAVKTHTKVRFNRQTLREVVDALADYAGGDWYVDYDKKLHFFPAEDSSAPFELSDDPDFSESYPYDKLVRNTDGAGLENRIEVVGGDYLSDDQTIYLQGTGQEVRVALPFRMSGPEAGGALQVWRNDGTEVSPSWTSMTVKVGYIDTLAGADEVLHYYQEKVLEQNSAWPNLPNAVKVTGRFEIPLRTRVSSSASQDFYGRIFDGVINDPDITDKNTAKLAGKGRLAQVAMGRVALTCQVHQPGLLAGQTIRLVNDARSIDGDFLIQEVTATVGIGGRAVFDLSLGVSDPDLVDIMLKLARAAKSKPLWREDEVLDELLETSESLALVESGKTATADSAPYHWGPGGANPFDWGFGRWG